jgi:deoxyribodipyrimidine photo-lyase
MNTGIWWIRRDLRLADNEALTAVLRAHSALIPLFIMDPALLRSPYVGPKRLAFLWAGLRQLDADLRRRGSYLLVRQGRPADVLATVLNDTGATAVYAEADYSPYARQRDQAIQARLPLRLLPGVTVHPPDDVLRPDRQPYTVFTPFSKRWRQRPLPHPSAILPAPDHIPTPANIPGDNLPDLPTTDLFPAGEAEAQRRLRAFTSTNSSGASSYLHFVPLPPRAEAALSARNTMPFPGAMMRKDFAAWQNGRSGFPIVDAAMRQLHETGWMHNRARMIVASFLVKDLLIDWRWGERHFMQHLVDGDPAANNGGWQWTAGTGTDAAPTSASSTPPARAKSLMQTAVISAAGCLN